MAIRAKRSGYGRVAGFSVLEAVIVLAITGLALTIVFQIGSRASQMGFRLGQRVLDVADTEVVAVGFHAIVSGLVVPSDLDPSAGDPRSPPPLIGDANHLQAAAITDRKTACGDEGANGLATLAVDNTNPHHALVTCQSGTGPKSVLEDFGAHPVAFSYSTDGQTWSDTVRILPGPAKKPDPGEIASGTGRPQTVFVRLASEDGEVLVVDKAWTGRPSPPPIDMTQ